MSERVCCVVVSPKTESISAIALAAMANTTMSWSVKSTVSISASNWNFIQSDNNRVGGPQVPVELGTLETNAFGGVGLATPGSSIQRVSLCGVASGRVVTPLGATSFCAVIVQPPPLVNEARTFRNAIGMPAKGQKRTLGPGLNAAHLRLGLPLYLCISLSAVSL